MKSNLAAAVTSELKPFDPYHKWLGIRDNHSPPNHYRLLGLELWEADEDVIRDAFSRQTSHVRHYGTGPHRDLCERILNELKAARDTLLDPQLRRPYDRWLNVIVGQTKTDMSPRQPFAVHSGAGQSTTPVSGAELRCAHCGAENASARKFCSGCGAALWTPCIECGVMCGPGEVHCGACGVNLAEAIERHSAEFQNQLDQAARLHQERDDRNAIQLLDQLLVNRHPRLAAMRATAEQTAAQIRAELTHFEELAKGAIDDATRLKQLGDFERAALRLEQLPSQIITPQIEQLLDAIRHQQIESLTLTAEIQRAVKENRHEGLLQKVEQLLQLQPNHSQMQDLRARLVQLEGKKIESRRARLHELALAKFEQREFDQATSLLEQIPDEQRTPEIVKFLEKTSLYAAESAWLRSDIRDAVIYHEKLLPIAERLLKLHPGDALAKQAIDELRRQSTLAPADRLKSKSAWPRFPAKSHWGFPIATVRGFENIDVDAGATNFLKRPDDFCVAIGLALQGLDRASLNTNLLPPEKRGLLGRLKIRKRPPTKAWGIDLGQDSMKAVQMTLHPETNRPIIVDSFQLPVSAGPGDAAAGASEIPPAVLQSLLEQKSLADSVVAVGISAQKTLMRFFAIPRLDRKRISELMQYEVKQQIPVPLETMTWDYHVLSPDRAAVGPRSANDDEIALFAAKLEDVKALLQPFADRGVKVDFLQSNGAALHNFLVHERYSSATDRRQPSSSDRRIAALLDVGADSSTLLVTDGQTMFMRSIPAGGAQFTRALCKQYKLDRQQGESLKRNPTATKLMHRWYEALQPGLQNLSAEVQKSIEQYTATDKQTVHQLLVIGGGARLHGLLRYLNFGR